MTVKGAEGSASVAARPGAARLALQIAVERGLPGLLAWLAIFALFFVHTIPLVRRLPAESADRTLVVGRVARRFGMAAFKLTPAGEPDRRFQSASELAEALGVAAGVSVRRGPVSSQTDGRTSPLIPPTSGPRPPAGGRSRALPGSLALGRQADRPR